MKIAAMEAMWDTEPAPASLHPDRPAQPGKRAQTDFAIKIPYVLGHHRHPLARHGNALGINHLIAHAENRIRNGIVAYDALQKLQANRKRRRGRALAFDAHWPTWATPCCSSAIRPDIHARPPRPTSSRPRWTRCRTWRRCSGASASWWRCGFYFIALLRRGLPLALARAPARAPGAVPAGGAVGLPLPWVAIERGWFVAEYGRQPWVIEGVLPTFLRRVRPDDVTDRSSACSASSWSIHSPAHHRRRT